jgi:hypothetical protein
MDAELDRILNGFNTWSYSAIKEFAPQLGLRVDDMLAMSSKNDPFYVEPRSDDAPPAVLAWARWIANLWPRLGFPKDVRVHDRRIHYKLLSMGDVTLPEGKFEGQLYGVPRDPKGGDVSWGYMQTAVKNARYLHLIDYDQIEDQRNPEADVPDVVGVERWLEPPTVEISPLVPLNMPTLPDPPSYVVHD